MDKFNPRCDLCTSSQAITDGGTIIAYECHHNAPPPGMVIDASNIVVTPQLVWPVLKSIDWCADFTRKDE